MHNTFCLSFFRTSVGKKAPPIQNPMKRAAVSRLVPSCTLPRLNVASLSRRPLCKLVTMALELLRTFALRCRSVDIGLERMGGFQINSKPMERAPAKPQWRSPMAEAIEKYAVDVLKGQDGKPRFARNYETFAIPNRAITAVAIDLGIERSKFQRWKSQGWARKPRPSADDVTALYKLGEKTGVDPRRLLTGK